MSTLSCCTTQTSSCNLFLICCTGKMQVSVPGCSALPLMCCACLQRLHARLGSTSTCTAPASMPLSFASQQGRVGQPIALVSSAVHSFLPRYLQNAQRGAMPLPLPKWARPIAKRLKPKTPCSTPMQLQLWAPGPGFGAHAAHSACSPHCLLPPALISNQKLRPRLRSLANLLKTTDRLQPIPFPRGSLSHDQRASIYQEAARQADKLTAADCHLAAMAEAEGAHGYSCGGKGAAKCIKMPRDQYEVQPALDRAQPPSRTAPSSRGACLIRGDSKMR